MAKFVLNEENLWQCKNYSENVAYLQDRFYRMGVVVGLAVRSQIIVVDFIDKLD